MTQAMASEFDGRVALVTGAARGIGRASALAFADRGAAVVVSDVLDEAEETVHEIRERGGTARFVRCDVAEPHAVAGLVKQTVSEFGRLDFAHNNAGVFVPALLADLADEDWEKVIRINLTAVFQCMKHEIRAMSDMGGAIVNTASVWSFAGAAGQAAYAASKHGVLGLTRTAAADYGTSGIRVNAVAPGPVETAMTASVPPDALAGIVGRTTQQRMGQPREIGAAVAWLCSESASYVNGAVLPVDGGWLAV